MKPSELKNKLVNLGYNEELSANAIASMWLEYRRTGDSKHIKSLEKQTIKVLEIIEYENR